MLFLSIVDGRLFQWLCLCYLGGCVDARCGGDCWGQHEDLGRG